MSKFAMGNNSKTIKCCFFLILTAREELVQIRHIFHTSVSHIVNFAHVVKLYVAYMHNLHIDKKTP